MSHQKSETVPLWVVKAAYGNPILVVKVDTAALTDRTEGQSWHPWLKKKKSKTVELWKIIKSKHQHHSVNWQATGKETRRWNIQRKVKRK